VATVDVATVDVAAAVAAVEATTRRSGSLAPSSDAL
jgi:hypothetical protein